MDLATAFFLTDIYGSEDLSRLDADVRRVVPAMKRVLPAAGLEIVAQVVELEVLSEDLGHLSSSQNGKSPLSRRQRQQTWRN